MRRAAHLHHLQHAEVEIALRRPAARRRGAPRDRGRATLSRVRPSSVTSPASGASSPSSVRKQRGLAAAVGTQQAHDLAAREARGPRRAPRGGRGIRSRARARRASWGAPERDGEQHDEDRRADERGDHARRDLGREHRAARRVDGEHERPRPARARAAAGGRRPRPRAAARHAARAARPSRWFPRATTAEAVASVAATITTMRRRLTFDAEARAPRPRKAPARRCASAGATDAATAIAMGSERRGQVARQRAGEASQQPERDRGKLVVGIGHVLHERDARAEERAHDDAGEHEREDRIAPADPRADRRRRGPRRRGRPRRRSAWIVADRQRRRAPRCPRRARSPRTRRGCRARRADCGRGSGTRRPPRRAPRPRASAAATRGARTCSTIASTLRARPLSLAGERRPQHAQRRRPAGTAKRPDREAPRDEQREQRERDREPDREARAREDHRGATPGSDEQRVDLRRAWAPGGRRAGRTPRPPSSGRGWKSRRIEDLGEPQQADEAIGARRIVEPSERQVRREVDALLAHGLDANSTPAASTRRDRSSGRW